jgi:hypothetical protein
MMKPWERRLSDLWLLLERCHATYMAPELFRLNTNQFLQTSRTVTFIIQKNKGAIPSFVRWYPPIVASWATDEVMVWAKDSRNKIEKEGDLELHSSLELKLFFSYLVEKDITLTTGKTELLRAGTKKLVRFAQKRFPTYITDSSAIKIERKWVANSLPEWELLQALSYVYTKLYRMCEKLAIHLGSEIDGSIPDPTSLYPYRECARQVQYLKLSDLSFHSQRTKRIEADPNYSPPAAMAAANIREKFAAANTIDRVFLAMSEMAELTFEHDGYHIPMVYLLDENMKAVDFTTVAFVDRVDKFIFWRNLADRMVATGAKSVVSIGEAWIRDRKQHGSQSIKELPIVGERLYVNVLDHAGWYRSAGWEIVRTGEESRPTLRRLAFEGESDAKIPFYFAPILRAWGVPYPAYFTEA